jgi:hypothetical protein
MGGGLSAGCGQRRAPTSCAAAGTFGASTTKGLSNLIAASTDGCLQVKELTKNQHDAIIELSGRWPEIRSLA